MRAVVLLELDQVGDRELALERRHVADVGAAKRIDALVVVADGEHRGAAARQRLEPAVLQAVGVLELVDQDVLESALVVRAQQRVALEQLVAAKHQFGEVDHALFLALRVVGLVQLDAAPRVVVVRLDRPRAQPFLLGVVDEVLDVARREFLIVDVQRADQALDRRELVLAVEDLEGLREIGFAVVRAQHPVAQSVKGADPHPARVDRQHRREPRAHLARGLVGERDREHARGTHLTSGQQPGDPCREYARLAAAGAGEDQRVLRRQRHRGVLGGIEVLQEILHRRSPLAVSLHSDGDPRP